MFPQTDEALDMFPQTDEVKKRAVQTSQRMWRRYVYCPNSTKRSIIVNVRLDMDEMDLTAAESKATYEEIKKYVAEHNDGMKVSNLYIAQVKAKHGIIERENYNLPKSEEARQPKCPKEKEEAYCLGTEIFSDDSK